MIAQLCSRRRVDVFRVGISAVTLLLILVGRERAMATPVVAQACYTRMPVLDAFGRYIVDDYGAADLAQGNDAGQDRLPNIDVGVHNNAPAYADSRLQWRVAYAGPAKTDKVGVFGENGALGFTGSALIPGVHAASDTVITPYIKKEPRPASSSFRCQYATETDSNPGYLWPRVASNPIQPAGSAGNSWLIGSARQMDEHEHDRRTINFTYYQTNPLGGIGATRLIPQTGVQSGGGPGFSYAIDPYTRFSTTISVQNQRPALSILMQFKPTLWSHVK